jgi:hypothetical protein
MDKTNEKKHSGSVYRKFPLEKSKTLLTFENNLKNLENTLNKNKKNYLSYKDDLKTELKDSYIESMNSMEYEKALNILKKLINLNPTSIMNLNKITNTLLIWEISTLNYTIFPLRFLASKKAFF